MIKFRFLSLFLYTFNICVASHSQELFLQANKLCKAGDFEKAFDIYNAIEHKGEAVWYNIGNCCFYKQDYVTAIWAWMHAYKIGSGEVFVNSKYNIEIVVDLLKIKNYDFDYFKINFLILQILILMINLLITFFLFSFKFNNKTLLVSIFLLIAMILGINFWYVKENRLVYAVVQDAANLVAGPANSYHVLDNIMPGQILKIEQFKAGWCYINDGNVNGWIANNNLLIV